MDLLTKLQSPFRKTCDPKLRIGAGWSPGLGFNRQPDLERILRSDAVVAKRRKQTDHAFRYFLGHLCQAVEFGHGSVCRSIKSPR